MNHRDVLELTCGGLLERHPSVRDFFHAFGLNAAPPDRTVADVLAGLTADAADDDPARTDGSITDQLLTFIEGMEAIQRGRDVSVRCLTLQGGRDKAGRPENVRVDLRAGEVIAVVGPTGSGKSMLLSDIECLAQADTPSGRRILIDGRSPGEAERLSGERRLVAQLSQTMNFVMDLSVHEFLCLHAESRLVEDPEAAAETSLHAAVRLSGEPFDQTTPVTALSGGQSRALMIADVACLSASPVVLIDEIENAGVDRHQALDLLVKREKIVLMATHDPLLALSGNRRLVIRNGGIAAELETSAEERALLRRLESLDERLRDLRYRIRRGERLAADEFNPPS